MTSICFIEAMTYNFFMILITLTYFSKLILRKTLNITHLNVLNKYLLNPDLSAIYNVLFFYLIQGFLLYTWKNTYSFNNVTPYIILSVFIFLVMSFIILRLTMIFNFTPTEKIIVVKSSFLLIIGIQLFSLIKNFLTLLFGVELISIIYLFFFLNPDTTKHFSPIKYKNLVSTYIWNSFFVLLLFTTLIYIIAYYSGTLDFSELILAKRENLKHSYTILILAIAWKAGVPGFHFFKYELYKYLSNPGLLLFSAYTLFINFFILNFILTVFKPLLLLNLTFVYIYILIVNVIVLYRGSTSSTLYTFLAISAVNTWGTVFIFGLVNCPYKLDLSIQLSQ